MGRALRRKAASVGTKLHAKAARRAPSFKTHRRGRAVQDTSSWRRRGSARGGRACRVVCVWGGARTCGQGGGVTGRRERCGRGRKDGAGAGGRGSVSDLGDKFSVSASPLRLESSKYECRSSRAPSAQVVRAHAGKAKNGGPSDKCLFENHENGLEARRPAAKSRQSPAVQHLSYSSSICVVTGGALPIRIKKE
jgi:hypothetical protein